MKFLLLILSVLFYNVIISQVIPEELTSDWPEVIENMNITQPTIQLNVKNFGAKGDGITDDTEAVIDAIDNLNNSYGYVYFPAGEYLIQSTLELPDSCVLKGDGSESTTLLFNLGEEAVNCISIAKGQNAEFTGISGGFSKGNDLITVENSGLFNDDDYIEIRQENGSWDIVPISWADYSVGQITRVKEVVGNKLLLESSLRIDYSEDLNPEVRVITPITNAGVQCLKIKRLDEPEESAGNNIYMYMAANCFVRGVESDTSVSAHVGLYSCLNVLIDGNYFHHAFKYDGAGMRGYGVALSVHTSECLITNNIFRYLRHAMMIKTGSNGNIFSYNYSIEPHRSEPIPDASGDISFHGHYAFSNLWEGNIVQNIIIDHYWGPTGPYNTLFRNRAELWGIIMTTNQFMETNKQNFVGNETTNTDLLHGLYTLTGTDHFEYGNNILGEIIPDGTVNLPDESYYLDSAPDFWGTFLEWPSIGIPIDPGTGTIPAKIRYQAGNDLTICPDSIITKVETIADIEQNIRIWPIPANDILNISSNRKIESQFALVMNILGQKIGKFEINKQNNKVASINTSQLEEGNYFIIISIDDKQQLNKFLIHRQ